MSEKHPLDRPILAAEPLAARVAAGEEGAFRGLMAALWEPCVGLVGKSPAMRALSASEDDQREVATRVMAKLERDGGHALRLYAEWHERHPDKDFADWFKITVANVIRDFARERRGSDQRRLPGELSKKRLLNDFAKSLPLDDMGRRPPLTDAQTARQLLEFARERLPSEQLAALESWLQGADYGAIASSRGLEDAAQAKKLVRAAVAVLRRHFGDGSEPA
jgi:hypothetical protein